MDVVCRYVEASALVAHGDKVQHCVFDFDATDCGEVPGLEVEIEVGMNLLEETRSALQMNDGGLQRSVSDFRGSEEMKTEVEKMDARVSISFRRTDSSSVMPTWVSSILRRLTLFSTAAERVASELGTFTVRVSKNVPLVTSNPLDSIVVLRRAVN